MGIVSFHYRLERSRKVRFAPGRSRLLPVVGPFYVDRHKETIMALTITEAPAAFLAQPASRPTQELLDTIRDGAAAGDATGDLVAAHDLMLDDGSFHILVPRELGGAGGTATDWF